MSTWTGDLNGTTNSKYRVCIDYSWADNGSGRTYTYNVYCQVTTGNFNGTNVTSNFSGNFSVRGVGVYARTSNRTATVPYGGTFNPGTFYVQYTEGKYRASISKSESVPRPTYTVTFNANNGTGAPSTQTKTYGIDLTLSSTKPNRSGYTFLGWSADSTATTATYQAGGTYSGNANITLYAVWQVASLIDVTCKNSTYTVKSETSGKVTTTSLSALSLSFTTVYITANKSSKFYVRLSDIDGENSTIYGSYTASSNPTFSISISKNLILAALQKTTTATEFKIKCEVCTGGNSFGGDLTSSKLITIKLNNFKFLSSTSSELQGYRNSDGTTHIKVGISFSPTYSIEAADIKFDYIKINNISTSLNSYSGRFDPSTNIYLHYFDLPISQLTTTKAGIVELGFSDNIRSISIKVNVNAVGSENIYIHDSYNSKSNVCRCVEFVETESDDIGFQKGGKVIANEFIETDYGIQIGKQMHFGQLIEI